MLKKRGKKAVKKSKSKSPILEKKPLPTKLIFILVGLLIIVLGILAARLFVFNANPAIETHTPTTPDEPVEIQQTTSADAMDDDPANDNPPVESQDESMDTDMADDQPMDNQSQQQSEPMTFEEFKKEASTRVYRERRDAMSP